MYPAISDSGLASHVNAIEVGPVWTATLLGGKGGAVVSGTLSMGE